MKVYTRGGDQGKTSLIGGHRRYKDDIRVRAYGSVDEAGAFIGLATAYVQQDGYDDMAQVLTEVSQTLWDVGADLATAHDDLISPRTASDAASRLEPVIDHYQSQVPPIQKFVLRQGSLASAYLHVACTIVRRAEREVVSLMKSDGTEPSVLKYLNRLSDLLFVMARVANYRSQTPEVSYRHSPDVFH